MEALGRLVNARTTVVHPVCPPPPVRFDQQIIHGPPIVVSAAVGHQTSWQVQARVDGQQQHPMGKRSRTSALPVWFPLFQTVLVNQVGKQICAT